MKAPLSFGTDEAALVLSSMVAAADDDPSEAELAVLRDRLPRALAPALEARLAAAGLSWPADLPSLAEAALGGLESAPEAARLQVLSVVLEVALADGRVDQEELRLLARFASRLGVGLSDVDAYRASLARGGQGAADPAAALALGPREAGAALAALVAAADDDPSDAELALLREYCSARDYESLIEKLAAAGLAWPSGLPKAAPAIRRGLAALDRRGRLAYLTLAYRVALADGEAEAAEMAILEGFCADFLVGVGELKACAPALEALFRGF